MKVQRSKGIKKRLVAALIAAVMVVVSITPVFAGADGNLYAAVNGVRYDFTTTSDLVDNVVGDAPVINALRNILIERIAYAEALILEGGTITTVAGTPVEGTHESAEWDEDFENDYWARPAAFSTFRNALTAAGDSRDLGTFARGSEFDITIGIEGNTGFAGMIVAFDLPAGLEAVGFNHNLADAPAGTRQGLVGPRGWDPAAPAVPLANLTTGIFAGWAGRSENIGDLNGDLFTLTVRVTDTAPLGIGEIGLRFANHLTDQFEVPTRLAIAGEGDDDRRISENVSITLPHSTGSLTGRIGRIVVVE